MSGSLKWDFGGRLADRETLRGFTCTRYSQQLVRTAAGGTRRLTDFPGSWEYNVQGAVRNLRPPLRLPKTLLIGRRGSAIAAVVLAERVGGSAAETFINLFAVSESERSRGGLTADEAMEVLLAQLVADASADPRRDGDILYVTGNVHELNAPCQRFLQRQGFALIRRVGRGLDEWYLQVALD